MSDTTSGSKSAALFVLSLAAGAGAMWLLSETNRNKLTTGAIGNFIPEDWLKKTAKALTEGRDRLISKADTQSR